MAKNMEKAKECSEFSTPSFTGQTDIQESQATENKRKVWTKENLPLVKEN